MASNQSSERHDIVSMPDPDPIQESASADEKKSYIRRVNDFGREFYDDVVTECDWIGKRMWAEFTSTIREESIIVFSNRTALRWKNLLVSRGVFVRDTINETRINSLLEFKSRK